MDGLQRCHSIPGTIVGCCIFFTERLGVDSCLLYTVTVNMPIVSVLIIVHVCVCLFDLLGEAEASRCPQGTD